MTAAAPGFTHGALFYEDLDGFLAGTVPFLREGVEAGEPALVAVDAEKEEALRRVLPESNGAIRYADMTELGRNPGRIISAWVDFADEHRQPGRRLRGIGEPLWPGRTADEIVEAQRHEALLNLAFADHPGFVLMCPYDHSRLDPSVLAEASRSHPVLVYDGGPRPSADYVDSVAPFAGSLSEPEPHAELLDLDAQPLAEMRRRLADRAAAAGIDPARIPDLKLAVTEAATNSRHHAGGSGVLRMWRTQDAFVCQVEDRGRIHDPLAGRLPIPLEAANGRGLWLINQLCDFVQIRSSEAGSVVRMHMRL